MRVQVLRLGAELLFGAFPQPYEHPPLTIEHDARAEMHGAVLFGLLREDHLDAAQFFVVSTQRTAGNRGGVAALSFLGKAQIDEAVLREARVQSYVQ